MEVAPIVANNKILFKDLSNFLFQYKNLVYDGDDGDKHIFYSTKANFGKIWYYNEFNDLEDEFTYNYTEDEIKAILKYLGNKIFAKDISFSNKSFFTQLINDFQKYLISNNLYKQHETIIFHPFDGMIFW